MVFWAPKKPNAAAGYQRALEGGTAERAAADMGPALGFLKVSQRVQSTQTQGA